MSRLASGLRAWVLQRITAIYLAAFSVFILVKLLLYPIRNYAQWKLWVADPMITIAFGIFFLALIFHAWVGIRDIILDYINSLALRGGLLSLLLLFLIGLALWSVRVLFSAAL